MADNDFSLPQSIGRIACGTSLIYHAVVARGFSTIASSAELSSEPSNQWCYRAVDAFTTGKAPQYKYTAASRLAAFVSILSGLGVFFSSYIIPKHIISDKS